MSDLLTVPEAAKVAGVSARTMRRWVTSGQVRTVGSGHGRRVVAASLSKPADTNGQNGHVDVTLLAGETATVDTETDTRPSMAAVSAEADHLADLVRELTGKLAEQTALTAVWMERARVLGEQLAIAAPADSLTAGHTAPEPPTPATDAPAPWWRAWWRW